MTTLFIIACALLSAALLGKLICSSLRPEDGYEDDLGFHYGPDPRRRSRVHRN